MSERKSLPIRLVAGVVVAGAASLAAATTDYAAMPEGEVLASQITSAVLTLGGLGLAFWGFLIWRRAPRNQADS